MTTTSDFLFLAGATLEAPHLVVGNTVYPVCPEKGVPYLSAYEDWRFSWDDEGFVPDGFVEVDRKYLPVTEDCDPQETPVLIWFVPEGEEDDYAVSCVEGVTLDDDSAFAAFGDLFPKA